MSNWVNFNSILSQPIKVVVGVGESKKKNLPTFVLWISQLPRGIEIPSWTFLNSPFHVDLKETHFLLFDDILTTMLINNRKRSFQNSTWLILIVSKVKPH